MHRAAAQAARLPLIDALKAVASQLIVLHHLAFYGPMSDVAAPLAPALFGWLTEHARVAVQVFLVIGGFLTARGLAGSGAARAAPGAPSWTRTPSWLDSSSLRALTWRQVLVAFARRYRRLAVPFIAAMGLAIVSAAIARAWMQHESVPTAPGLVQMLAHALLLHDLLGQEALSAGAWYVAIDLQLFGTMLLAIWLGQRLGAPWLPVLALAMASLFFFNRDAGWDVVAPYFFGAYALGAFAWQAHDRGRIPVGTILLFAATGAALALDFRVRIAVALAAAIGLAVAARWGMLSRWPHARPVSFLGNISYSVFLVHFPVCLVVNAAFARFVGTDPFANLAGIAFAWAASIAAGAVFHRRIEAR
jgi:peptidoglycan/LPS O-acetylase OafA/YrhL